MKNSMLGPDVALAVGIAFAYFTSCASSARTQELPRRVTLGAAVTQDAKGVRVTAVGPGTPAASAGLAVGDVIAVFGRDTVSSPADFVKAVRATPAFTPVSVTFLRGEKRTRATLRLVPAAKEADPDVETQYASIAVNGSLRRTLITTPKGFTGKLSALLLIGGIGCFTVDNPADPHDAYRLLAHDLSRTGVLVMRIEKAGIGDSQGGPCFNTDFDEESASYAVGLDSLRSDPRVNPTQIFLFGHSIGTLIAPRLAADQRVAGIVVADGVGINWFEYELANLRRQADLDGDSAPATDSLMRSKEVCMHRLLVEHQSEAAIEAVMPECRSRNSYPVAAPYMQEVAAINIAEQWSRVHVPVLAVYGTADFITTQTDHQRMVDIVNAAHPGTAELKLIEGMDHHLELLGTEQHAYDVRVKQHGDGPYARELSTVVVQWVCAHAACATTHASR